VVFTNGEKIVVSRGETSNVHTTGVQTAMMAVSPIVARVNLLGVLKRMIAVCRTRRQAAIHWRISVFRNPEISSGVDPKRVFSREK